MPNSKYFLNKGRPKKHGFSKDSFYNVWVEMRGRCFNKNNKDYKNYGGRGITICNRWRWSFENFYEDMRDSYLKHCKEFGKDTSIDRIDNNGNYEPGNCRWATKKEQRNNQRPRGKYKKQKLKVHASK